jgi:hypothetical protein
MRILFVSSKNIKKRGGYDVFIVQGFNNWKKVHDGKNCVFLVHVGSDPSSEHNNSVKECHDLLNNPIHIDNVMERRKNTEKQRNRLRLRISIASIKWLSFQSCALRGHDETHQSKNRGNFVELIKLIAEFNPEIACVVLENAPQCAKYTSPDIQKEILSIFALKVKKHIEKPSGHFLGLIVMSH